MKVNYHYPHNPIPSQCQVILFSCNFSIIILKMFRSSSPECNCSDLFYVEQSSGEPSPPRSKTPIVFNSKELSDNNSQEIITLSLSPIPSSEPQIVTIDSDSNEPTMPNGLGWQLPIIPPRLNDLNLLPNSFNILAIMEVAHPTAEGFDANYSPQSPELTKRPPISTPTMNLSTTEGWETPHTTTDDNTFYSNDVTRRFYFLLSSPSPNRHLAS